MSGDSTPSEPSDGTSKPKWHGDLPWRWALRTHQTVRSAVFTAPQPKGRVFRVDASTDRVRTVLGLAGYHPQRWSYDKGEDHSLARVFYDPDSGVWRQHHARVWSSEGSDGSTVMAHEERAPEFHPKEHLRGVDYRRGPGMEEVREILSFADVAVEEGFYDG